MLPTSTIARKRCRERGLMMSGSSDRRPKSGVKRTSGGRSTRRSVGPRGHEYWIYRPAHVPDPAPILVTVHGISRNAREQVQLFRPWADQYGFVLIAPLFPADGSARYQRLESDEPADRADRVLHRILRDAEELTGISTDRPFFFGFSGGGQFVHRYTMAYPERVAAAVLGAPGWFTFPDREEKYPLGLKGARTRLSGSFDPDRFLCVPTTVLVGERDTERDAALNANPLIDRRQGLNRLERGRNWIRRGGG
jgi:poly(3-hydroxybutyrate) depolymerase